MKLPTISHPELDEDLLKTKGVSVVAFFDHVRKRKDGTASIKLKIIFKRYPKYYSTKISMDEKSYLKLCEGKKSVDLKTKRIKIYESLKKAFDIINELPEFSFEAFDNKFKQKRTEDNIFPYFDNYIKELNIEGRVGNVIPYFYARKKLQEFHKKGKLPFETITVQFLKKFEKWMFSKDCSPTSIGYYTRCFKKIYNDAIRDGNANQSNYPFGATKKGLYSPPSPRNIKKALSLADLKKIFEYKPIQGSSEHYYFDIWKFSYLCNGINMKDICLLKYSNIIGNSIYFNRAKLATTKRNGKPIQISIIEQTKEIIESWGNKPTLPETYIFPILKKGLTPLEQQAQIKQLTKQVNKYIKRIAVSLEIKQNVSTYTARHSFSTVLKRSGVSIEYISESLGHSNLKTTESYLDSFEDETREANTKKLLEF